MRHLIETEITLDFNGGSEREVLISIEVTESGGSKGHPDNWTPVTEEYEVTEILYVDSGKEIEDSVFDAFSKQITIAAAEAVRR